MVSDVAYTTCNLGSKEELESQLESFDERLNRQKAQRKRYANDLEDVHEELKVANKRKIELVQEKAAHEHEAAVSPLLFTL